MLVASSTLDKLLEEHDPLPHVSPNLVDIPFNRLISVFAVCTVMPYVISKGAIHQFTRSGQLKISELTVSLLVLFTLP